MLMMSKTREASTLAITLALVGISFGLLAVPNESLDAPLKSTLGFLIGSLGISFREMMIWRESREGLMHKTKGSKIASLRFTTSLLFRIIQVMPLVVWAFVLFPSQIIAISIGLLFLAFTLSVNEHYRLWK